MTTEMQEIAITEEKPLVPAPTDATKEAEAAARILLDSGTVHVIETPHGPLRVTVQCTTNARRPAILTVHDVGLDSKSCFSPLFRFDEMQEIVKNFALVHIDLPGQEEGAALYPAGYTPSLLHCVCVCVFRSVIGVGVGAGSNILSKFALAHPDSVEGLVLINMDPNARGWMEWAAHKVSYRRCVLVCLCEELVANTELLQAQRERISKAPHLSNVELLWKSYNSRRDITIDRSCAFKCPVMLVVGDQAPYEDAAVECNSKLDPTTTSFLKMADAGGLPQLTQPAKLTEAFKYFIQGMGYMASSCMTRLSRSRTTSLSSSFSMDGSRSRSRTLSQGSQGGPGGPVPPSPPQTMEVSC
uniref:Protein NDRG2 n=1 Tax=Gadus morhua TaxID=8049 RepID=A0A8C5AGQ7_GADMO